MEKILVTSALPYANGPIHIGHIAGAYLPADIYVRFQKLMKNDVVYICGTDEHGVPITITADKEGITPKDVVDKYHKNIKESFEKVGIEFDIFSRTTTTIHKETSQKFFLELLENNYISTGVEKQLYCEDTKRFLPDRYVEGTCPYCGNPNARGDECPKCGKWLEAIELKNPRSSLCKSELVIKESKHWFLDLDKIQPLLEKWIKEKDWKENVKNFVLGWFKEGLQKRPITRDLHWGIPIPLSDEETKGKVLYVWFDAPIGYLSNTIEWAMKKGEPEKWKEYWLDPKTKLVHFIGKDNIPFHAIVWPAMLMGQKTKYILPSEIPANEHLTVEGEKISTSRGNAVWVDEFVEQFPAEYLRYYLAVNAPENKDADFSWKNFQAVINNELINVVANLFNRVLTFAYTHFDQKIPPYYPDLAEEKDKIIEKAIQETFQKTKQAYSSFQVREATRIIIELARLGNQYFQENEPWKLIKTQPQKTANIIHNCIRLIEALALLYYPIIPKSAEKMFQALSPDKKLSEMDFNNFRNTCLENRKIPKPKPLFKKVEDKEIEKALSLMKARMEKLNKQEKSEGIAIITLEDFKKVELRIGKVMEASRVPKSDKLIVMRVKIGEEVRQIVGGLYPFYEPEQLIGKKVVVVANLKPAKLMGLDSYGMLLAAKKENKLELLTINGEIEDGAVIS